VSPPDALAALEGTLEQIYTRVNPSVVNIRVLQKEEVTLPAFPEIPGLPFFGLPGPRQPQEFYRRGQGSGFVWDTRGHIVTNNHVVSGADRISVTFYDGTTVSGEVVGSDPDSDLAVVRVDVPAGRLHPVQMADSTKVKVGQLAVAIGNPFGQQGTMTVGFISALGRLLPADTDVSEGPAYSIPDVIQTDAPINPGNSGGVLVDSAGRVIGVTSAIISPVKASAGVGFAIPSAIVRKVVPALTETGHYEHPWLGISGVSLTPELAKAMGLKPDQRGALVVDVVPDSPADNAGLRGSDRQVSISGGEARVGGDVIVAIDGQPVNSIDDLVAYLARETEIGQRVALSVLRQGKKEEVKVVLAARPSSATRAGQTESSTAGRAWLGILGLTVTPEIADAMGLPPDQQGVLVQQVEQGSPADQAGLRGSYKPVVLNGRRLLVGGDIIVDIDGVPLSDMEDMRNWVQRAEPGQEVMLTVLRDGHSIQVRVTLGERPAPRP
jgi:S1-C subfamily serine protease